MPEKTNAMRALDAATVNYSVHEYALAEDEFSAVAVADQLGLPHGQVFKTLCVQASTGEYCFAIVPAGTNLSLKALAKAAGHKKVEMVPVRDVRAVTGYPRGSVTVMAARKIFPVYVDTSAQTWDKIAVSAGTSGLQLLLVPAAYLRVTSAKLIPIAHGP